MLLNGTIIGNRYEILEKIGTGGTADVYKAKCHKLNRFVAIKVLKREFSEDSNFITKFRIEAQSAAGMAHANIINVYDVGVENGIHYIVMELAEGITLKQYIDRKGALEYKEAVSIAIQIAQGIEAAHRHNIIHRDIKPQNILITKEGKVKVADFGIAKVTNTDTVHSMAMGSVHYISPEQARGGYSDVTSDIYSFGITLYEMCAGRVPFDGDTTVAVALMHIQNELISPRVYNPSIPVSVEMIIMKCAQKRVDRRYQSATELIADLKHSLITPYENFVDMGNEIDISPTVMFTQDEMNQINARKQQTQDYGHLEGYEQQEYQDDSNDLGLDMEIVTDNSIDLTHIYNDEEPTYEEHYHLKHEEDDEDEEDDEVKGHDSNKIDKIMVWLGIGVAVVIVIVTIAVVVKMMSTFNDLGEINQRETTTISTESTTASNMVEVPPLTGLTEEEAKEALSARSLGFLRVEENSEAIAKGLVIAQSVDAGTMVEPHTQVTVVISKGGKTFELKTVVDMTEEEAKKMLEEEYNLKVEVEYEYSNNHAQGVVMKMIPVAGAQVRAGDTVTLTISRGGEVRECVVPDIYNKTESEARMLIEEAGLVPQLGGTVSSSIVEEGRVVTQDYVAGTKLSSGMIVEYILSSGSNEKAYRGRVTLSKDALIANQINQIPEGFDEVNGKREVQAVFRQTKDGQEHRLEVMAFTDLNAMSDTFEINFNGIVQGVNEGDIDTYVRYTWTDAATGETRTVTQDALSLHAYLVEAAVE